MSCPFCKMKIFRSALLAREPLDVELTAGTDRRPYLQIHMQVCDEHANVPVLVLRTRLATKGEFPGETNLFTGKERKE